MPYTQYKIDVTNDQLDDLEISVEWKSSSPSGETFKCMRGLLTTDPMKGEIVRRLKEYENEYRQL